MDAAFAACLEIGEVVHYQAQEGGMIHGPYKVKAVLLYNKEREERLRYDERCHESDYPQVVITMEHPASLMDLKRKKSKVFNKAICYYYLMPFGDEVPK